MYDLSKSSTFSGRSAPLVSGNGKTSNASTTAKIASVRSGSNGEVMCNDATSGANMEPILENITAVPTPAFLTTVGYSSPVKRYKAGRDTYNNCYDGLFGRANLRILTDIPIIPIPANSTLGQS